MALFPGEHWTEQYAAAINASEPYKQAAAGWEGDVSFVIEAEPEKGVAQDVFLWLDLWHGDCRQAKFAVPRAEAMVAKFVIRAPYSRWKQIIKKQLDPIKGMMQGKLKLKGHLPTIVRYVKAANELVNIASQIPTEFPDDRPAA